MGFAQWHMINAESLEVPVSEIERTRSTVIVIQGKPTHRPLKAKLMESCTSIKWYGTEDALLSPSRESEKRTHVAEVQWKFDPFFRSFIAFFRHPSRGWLKKDWQPIIWWHAT